MYTISEIQFKDILPYWRDHLWPGRKTVIEPSSAINAQGEIDTEWLRAVPRFWKMNVGDDISGVISGLFLRNDSIRLRGLWVDPRYRGQGFGGILLRQVTQIQQQSKTGLLWTMARQSAIGFYQANGLYIYSEVVGFEFGPHTIMHRSLEPDKRPDITA